MFLCKFAKLKLYVIPIVLKNLILIMKQNLTSHILSLQVKVRLHQRLQELEPLPDMLKSTELKLFESQERMLLYEKKNTENTKLIAELTAKVGN